MKILISSAQDKVCVFGKLGVCVSCVKRLNSVDANIEPCGTPFVSLSVDELVNEMIQYIVLDGLLDKFCVRHSVESLANVHGGYWGYYSRFWAL